MQTSNVSDVVDFVGPRCFAIVHFTNGFKAILLQVESIGEIANDPSKRVAEVEARGDYPRAIIKRYGLTMENILPV